MLAVVTLACGLLLCACFDSHGAEDDRAPRVRDRKAEDIPRSREPAEEPPKADVPQTPDGLDWHAVYFVRRTVERPDCGEFKIAALGTPEAVRLTIDCWADSDSITISPNGSTYYLAQPGPTLHAASCEEDCEEASATRSALVDTPPCDAERWNALQQVLVGPDGEVIHTCANDTWFDEKGDVVYDGEQRRRKGPWHLGRNRLLFAGNYLIDLTTGEETKIRGVAPDDAHFRVVRAVSDGFWIVLWSVLPNEAPVLWRVDRTGEAALRGRYPALEGESLSQSNAALDSDGALYSVSLQRDSNHLESVVRRTIGGDLRVILDSSSPIGPLFETLSTGP